MIDTGIMKHDMKGSHIMHRPGTEVDYTITTSKTGTDMMHGMMKGNHNISEVHMACKKGGIVTGCRTTRGDHMIMTSYEEVGSRMTTTEIWTGASTATEIGDGMAYRPWLC